MSEGKHLRMYLGDGAYAAMDPDAGEIELFTHDGLRKTNRVVLGPSELKAFDQFRVICGMSKQETL